MAAGLFAHSLEFIANDDGLNSAWSLIIVMVVAMIAIICGKAAE